MKKSSAKARLFKVADPASLRGWVFFICALLVLHAGVGFAKIAWIYPMNQEVLERKAELDTWNNDPFVRFHREAMEVGFRVDCEGGCRSIDQFITLVCANRAAHVEQVTDAKAAMTYLSGCIEGAGRALKACEVSEPECTFLGRRSLWRPWMLAGIPQ